MLALCLGLTLSTAAYAADPEDEKSKVDEQLDESRHALNETSAELIAAYEALEKTRAELPGARKAAEDAAAAEGAAQGEFDKAVAALNVAQANEAKAERDLKKTNGDITRARKAVAGFAGEVYQQQGLGSLSVAVGADSPSTFIDRMIAADSAGGAQSDALDRLNTSRAGLVASGDKLEALREKTAEAKETRESALTAARDARAAADEAEGELQTLESDQTDQAKTLKDERAKEKERVAKLEARSKELGEILAERARQAKIAEEEIAAARAKAAEERRQSQSGSGSSGSGGNSSSAPPQSSGVLAVPVNAVVTSEYGNRWHPKYGGWKLHAGRDWGAACGTPVYAAESGTIISASPPGATGGYGNQIVIDHGVRRGVSLATTYNHLESFAKTSGSVSRGQVIGYVGTTGVSTGCHLHFETWENGTPVDPRGWL